LVASHAAWALARLRGGAGRKALARALAGVADASLRRIIQQEL